MSGGPKPSELVSVPDYAAMRGLPYRTVHRTLLALWLGDKRDGGGDWLLRTGHRRKLWVNLSRLKVAHPVLFEQHYVNRGEFEMAKAEIGLLQHASRDMKRQVCALGARVRATEGRLER